MQTMQQFFSWFSDNFRKQGIIGKIVIGSVTLFVLCCLCSIPIAILSPSSPQSTDQAEKPTDTIMPTQIPNYQIVQKEDVSYAGVVRLQFRILVDGPQTESQLRQICEYIIETEKMISYNAISFVFYLPDTDTQGSYTAGMAIWAPEGKWENANQASTGDYSRHKLLVEVGNAMGNTPTPSNTGFSEEIRRQIFFDLVTVQDSGVGDEESFEIVARKYGVTIDVVREIAIEGVIQGWPVP